MITIGLIIFLISFVSGTTPLFYHNREDYKSKHLLSMLDSLASGIFISIALLHMLNRAIDIQNNIFGSDKYPISILIMSSTFMIFFAFERILVEKQCVYFAMIMLSIHALIEGTAIGISNNTMDIYMLSTAIIVHKGAESMSISSLMVSISNNNRRHILVSIVCIFSLLTPIGMLLPYGIRNGISNGYGILNMSLSAISSGTFLYLGIIHTFDRYAHKHDCKFEILYIMIGFSVMSL